MLAERDNTGLWALTPTVCDSCTWRPLRAMMSSVIGNTGLDAVFCIDVINFGIIFYNVSGPHLSN